MTYLRSALKQLIVCGVVAALSICRLHAACYPAPAGLVGWWPGEGNGVDVVGGNNGTLVNVGFTNGKVGQAFSFDPENYPTFTYTGVQIADQPAYALTNSLSIEGWVRPRGDGYVIFFRGDHRPGLDPYALSMQGNNRLDFQVTDADGNSGVVETILAYNVWTHVAATLDDGTGTMSIYTNGVLAAQTATAVRPFGELDPGQSPGIGIGNVSDGGNNFPFTGDIDEIALYNRALSSTEIAAIYNAGSSGKCDPVVADATATVSLVISANGSNATVVLDGSRSYDTLNRPLQYSWFADQTNLLATGAVAVVTLPVGTNSITLLANDGLSSNAQTIAVSVVTLPQAVDQLAAAVDQDAGGQQSLEALLRAALASIDRSNPVSAVNQLQSFQHKVQVQLSPIDPDLAQSLIDDAQTIINTIGGGGNGRTKLNLNVDSPGNKLHLNFHGLSGQTYIIESSSDMVNWQKVGVAQDQGTGAFDFSENQPTGVTTRFYRVVKP